MAIGLAEFSHNELGYTTLSVAEPAAQALASARLLASQEA